MGAPAPDEEHQPLLSPTMHECHEDLATTTTHHEIKLRRRRRRRSLQVIAHRGFKARYPENTMLSFERAIRAGAHAIETDVHISRDQVVVISHDPTLKRCFGVDKKIIDCDLKYLKTLRTVVEPHVPMPTLREVLEFLATDEESRTRGVWVLLDIKLDNNPDDVMRLIGETAASIGVQGLRERVVLGVWALKYLPLCEKYLKGFPIVHIGWSTAYARGFLEFQDVSFNLHWSILWTWRGRKFLKDARTAGRRSYAWTVNRPEGMKWAINHDLIDGVCTDNPEKFLGLCAEDSDKWETKWSVRSALDLAAFLAFSWFATLFLQRRYYFGGRKEKIAVRGALEN